MKSLSRCFLWLVIAIRIVAAQEPVPTPAIEGTIFNEPYRREFPRSGPRDAADMAAPQFRQLFLGAVAADLARIFTAYPSEQRNVID